MFLDLFRGQTIKDRRISMGWTQEQLASRVGVGRQYISKLELGLEIPSSNLMWQIHKALDIVYRETPEDNFSELIHNGKSEWTKTKTSKNDFTILDKSDYEIPLATLPSLDSYPKFEAPNGFVASSDYHIPAHDPEFISNIINLAVDWGVDVISIGGDFANYSNFSRYTPPRNHHFGEELEIIRKIVKILTQKFSLVIHHLGNHEIRLLDNVLKGQITASEFASMISDADNFVSSDYWFSEINEKGNKWVVAHPESTSIFAGKIARDLEMTKFPGRSVIAQHCHTAGITRTRDGLNWAITSGMVGDPNKLDYYVMKSTTGSAMMQGAVIVKDNWPWLLSPDCPWEQLSRVYR